MMGDGPLASRVERRADPLARHMLAELVRQIPLYSHLPQEQLQGEILDILRYNLTVFKDAEEPGSDRLMLENIRQRFSTPVQRPSTAGSRSTASPQPIRPGTS